MTTLHEAALRQILGWRELRSGADEIPIARIEDIARAALTADEGTYCIPKEFAGSMTCDDKAGPRLVGPHGGLRGTLPNPSEEDLADTVFEAIWQATKTWDVNAPEYYVGYCGMNGSHVMLIWNAVRKALAADSERVSVPREPTDAMICAGWDVEELQTPKRVWAAMLAAAEREPK